MRLAGRKITKYCEEELQRKNNGNTYPLILFGVCNMHGRQISSTLLIVILPERRSKLDVKESARAGANQQHTTKKWQRFLQRIRMEGSPSS